MKTKIKPIISWSIWAICLSVVMGLVTQKHLIIGFQEDTTGMSVVIAVLFVVGLVFSFLSAISLHKEMSLLEKTQKTNEIPESKLKGGLAEVFTRLQKAKVEGEPVNVRAAIDTYYSIHNSRVRTVSIMAGLVISMGLLGTVIGLIMAISGLGGMVENIGLSRTTMMDALKATVSGMGTAFYTTFFGAMSGLVLRAVAVSQLNSLSELCSEAAEYAENNLTARLGSKEEELTEQVSKVIGSFQEMQKEIETITSSLSNSFETTMKGFGESLAQAGDHALEATKDCISGMTAKMETFNDQIGTSIGNFNFSIIKAGDEIRNAISEVNGKIDESGEDLTEAFTGLNETIGTAGESVMESFAGLNETIGKSSGGLTESFAELNETVSKSGTGLTDSFEALNDNIGKAGEGVEEAFDSLDNSVTQAGDTVAGSLADFKLAVDGTSLELNEAVAELHSAIGQATGEMVSMAKAKLDTEASEISGQLALAAESIKSFLANKNNSDDSEQVA